MRDSHNDTITYGHTRPIRLVREVTSRPERQHVPTKSSKPAREWKQWQVTTPSTKGSGPADTTTTRARSSRPKYPQDTYTYGNKASNDTIRTPTAVQSSHKAPPPDPFRFVPDGSVEHWLAKVDGPGSNPRSVIGDLTKRSGHVYR
jgi:hypothetical protein